MYRPIIRGETKNYKEKYFLMARVDSLFVSLLLFRLSEEKPIATQDALPCSLFCLPTGNAM